MCLFFLSVDLTVSLRTVAVPWESAYYDDSCTGVVVAVATATPPTGAMDTKTITKNQGGATPRTRSKDCARAATPTTDCQLGSERSLKPVWTVRKSLIPIAPANLARTSVQEQNRQAERNAGEQHEFARSLCASWE